MDRDIIQTPQITGKTIIDLQWALQTKSIREIQCYKL